MAKLLLVDDDKMSGKMLQSRLKKRGFYCDYVINGEECLIAVTEFKYDLVLLDIMMPDISGVEVLSILRKNHNHFELPIIMVTAKDDAVDIVDALKKDANDYLTKPVNIDVAVARINTQLKITELMHENVKSKQLSTINTMVTTLNHEINNPLAIAVGNLSLPIEKLDEVRVKKILAALDRITEIVKKIDSVAEAGIVEETTYAGPVNMLKLK